LMVVPEFITYSFECVPIATHRLFELSRQEMIPLGEPDICVVDLFCHPLIGRIVFSKNLTKLASYHRPAL